MKRFLFAAFALGAAAALLAADGAGPFAVRVHGAFQRMMHARDFSAQVQLAEAAASGVTEAVGALSGLRGEATALQGRWIVTCGSGARCEPAAQESAALLVSAKAARWGPPIAVPRDMDAAQLRAFIAAQAQQAGLDAATPYPLRIQGTLRAVRMHVLSAPRAHGSGHGAQQDEWVHAALEGGEVVGIHAPAALQGMATHPGDAFHFHWVDGGRTRTAHLDAFSVPAGAVLLLPAR